MTGSKRRIGTENESSLHYSLKHLYAKQGETEWTRAGYVCDAIGKDGEAIEIQTGKFGGLKKKIPVLASEGKVRLIYPVIVNKTIELFDIEGTLIRRKKSPKKGNYWDIFNELVYVPEWIGMRNLTIEILMVNAIERRCDDCKGSWRRKGISITDKILENCLEKIILTKKSDWKRQFLPRKEQCTTNSFAITAGIKPGIARKTLYTLEKAGLLKKLRKERRCWVYRTL